MKIITLFPFYRQDVSASNKEVMYKIGNGDWTKDKYYSVRKVSDLIFLRKPSGFRLSTLA